MRKIKMVYWQVLIGFAVILLIQCFHFLNEFLLHWEGIYVFGFFSLRSMVIDIFLVIIIGLQLLLIILIIKKELDGDD